jgi:hypothetical protein
VPEAENRGPAIGRQGPRKRILDRGTDLHGR